MKIATRRARTLEDPGGHSCGARASRRHGRRRWLLLIVHSREAVGRDRHVAVHSAYSHRARVGVIVQEPSETASNRKSTSTLTARHPHDESDELSAQRNAAASPRHALGDEDIALGDEEAHRPSHGPLGISCTWARLSTANAAKGIEAIFVHRNAPLRRHTSGPGRCQSIFEACEPRFLKILLVGRSVGDLGPGPRE